MRIENLKGSYEDCELDIAEIEAPEAQMIIKAKLEMGKKKLFDYIYKL